MRLIKKTPETWSTAQSSGVWSFLKQEQDAVAPGSVLDGPGTHGTLLAFFFNGTSGGISSSTQKALVEPQDIKMVAELR